jgi:cytidylate kinase
MYLFYSNYERRSGTLKTSVAIDGPAGSGKSTIAKLIAQKFNLLYINTGSMYRAVTLKCLRENISVSNISEVCTLISKLEMHFEEDKLIVDGEDVSEEIRTPYISGKVSDFAAIPQVREIMVRKQRQMSNEYNVIMDGRDIGTVVLCKSLNKFYLTASPETRAKRRYEEFIEKGIEVEYTNILSDIIKRDYKDSHRKADPLTKASDAIVIDTSDLSIEAVVAKISQYIKQ